ncbi:hypothetical protein TSOC_002758 [Tetrabaena socialis]|uniref:Uncharacterized protein n=1 Tax=Tetrabaena socialis TaxID=47790 RepID=A0A2J8ADA9_9CHLO|nr:hypothetical protein TSOC_002758 [Tetrabaena socialis]|eukprot:PNH10508.1 hypothetical protein TSOC_002758 [Tetrabaena socialis]
MSSSSTLRHADEVVVRFGHLGHVVLQRLDDLYDNARHSGPYDIRVVVGVTTCGEGGRGSRVANRVVVRERGGGTAKPDGGYRLLELLPELGDLLGVLQLELPDDVLCAAPARAGGSLPPGAARMWTALVGGPSW